MRHPNSKPTAGRSKFKTRVAPNNASVGTQLYRATRNIENDRREVEICKICVSTYYSCLKPASSSVKPAFLRSHLHSILECRTTKGAKTKNETDLTSVEIHITCRCNQRALWAVSILERHPIAKPTASRSNLNYVSLQTSHFSNQGFCAASCQPFQIFAEHKM